MSNQWTGELKLLSEIAITQPHAAYAAYTHGFSSRWSYLSRTLPNISNFFQPIENIIRSVFIPTVTGQPPPNDTYRDTFALPTRLGGLGLCNPVRQSDLEFSASQSISGPLMDSILQQKSDYSFECMEAQLLATQAAEDLKQHLSSAGKRMLELASEKGGSNWLTSLPIKEFGFSLTSHVLSGLVK